MDKSFGNFLKEKRQENKLTQKDLAKLLFISESAISKWEKDIAHPDITLLPKLSEILGVSEHELITASVDLEAREEKLAAKKWKIISFCWDLFFYISYGISLVTCFICNLAINRSLSWFWIVLSALGVAFSFTNLPKLIKKHKLILLPLIMYASLCVLLATCALYTNGKWFWIASFAILVSIIIVFVPIYISKYKMFEKIKKYNDFVSIGIDFVAINILLLIIALYTEANGFTISHWYLTLALPITAIVYAMLNIFLCIRFIKTNKLIKTSIILYLVNLLYIFVPIIKTNNQAIQKELNDINIFKSNLSKWVADITLEQNIHLIIFLTTLATASAFLVFGLLKYFKNKKAINK